MSATPLNAAQHLITFLHQIERYQAALFERRKFVLQGNWKFAVPVYGFVLSGNSELELQTH